MDIILSHKTAFLFWRRFTAHRRTLVSTKRAFAMTSRLALTAEVRGELAGLGIPDPLQHALHVLFQRPELRSRIAGVKSHVCSTPLPAGSLLRLSPHVLIASPELTFMQLAEFEPFPRLVMAGCELCGTYALKERPLSDDATGLEKQAKTELVEREQLTRTADLREFADLLPERPGSAAARRAVSSAFDGAASPMEAKLALLLSLPQRLGGTGLPRPTLNHEIRLGKEARSAYHRTTCRCDLHWPGTRLDVEYDGADSHDGFESRARDVARTTALTIEGFNVFPVTYAQVADPDVFLSVARLIADQLGCRLRLRNGHFSARSASLRENLGIL